MPCGIHAQKDWASLCCGIPLGVGGFGISLFCVLWATCESYFLATRRLDLAFIILPILIVLCLLALAFLGFVTLFSHKSALARILVVAYKIAFIGFFVSFAVQMIFCVIGPRYSLDGERQPHTAVYVASIGCSITCNIVFLLSSHATLCIWKSLQKIYEEGGTGMERKNYQELKLDRARLGSL